MLKIIHRTLIVEPNSSIKTFSFCRVKHIKSDRDMLCRVIFWALKGNMISWNVFHGSESQGPRHLLEKGNLIRSFIFFWFGVRHKILSLSSWLLIPHISS